MESLFDRLKASCPTEWRSYTDHDFVRRMGDGTLPEAAFRHYLIQDYLFLIHFARAYALGVYKARTLAEMREASASMSAILDVEMELHVKLCAGWGIDHETMEKTPEATATIAYTRYVLERGMAGDLLDLHVALSPCVIGYAEIGKALADARTEESNPYRVWIDEYAGEAYQEVAAAARHRLDELGKTSLTKARFESLAETFATATRLEAGFWEMGLRQSM